MKKQGYKNKTQITKECLQDQSIHPCGSTEFCPEDPEKCVYFKEGLR